ncbi:hypothetical protein MMC08_004894 [Hypocenomyce scalaris]|nr:hypothetical protein [Hypocenomyce scalaris]
MAQQHSGRNEMFMVGAKLPNALKGENLQHGAQYIIAADGGRFSTPKFGVKTDGPTGLVDFVSTHFKVDLSGYLFLITDKDGDA